MIIQFSKFIFSGSRETNARRASRSSALLDSSAAFDKLHGPSTVTLDPAKPFITDRLFKKIMFELDFLLLFLNVPFFFLTSLIRLYSSKNNFFLHIRALALFIYFVTVKCPLYLSSSTKRTVTLHFYFVCRWFWFIKTVSPISGHFRLILANFDWIISYFKKAIKIKKSLILTVTN